MDPRITQAIADGVRKGATPEFGARLKASGLVLATTNSVEATRALIAQDGPRWREMVEVSGARIE